MKCLKVEDALSYLDEVKERFSGQGAIYTDFLDVMREFKMQTIGTEVVIRRVRELFEGHPDLIVGFNNFIPQGYRMDAALTRTPSTTTCRNSVPASGVENISPPRRYPSGTKNEGTTDWNGSGLLNSYDNPNTVSTHPVAQHDHQVFRSVDTGFTDGYPFAAAQQNICGVTYQENVNPTVRSPFLISSNQSNPNFVPVSHAYQQQQQAQSFNHALHYVNKIKNRFQGIPDAYKRFLDILQWYQREQRHSDPVQRKQAEKQVYQDVAKLFDGQEDLLQEFSQFLPESTGMTSAVTESFMGRKVSGSQVLDAVADMSAVAASTFNRTSEGISVSLSPSRQRLDSKPCHSTNSSNEPKKMKRLAPTLAAAPPNGCSASTVKKTRPGVRDVSLVDLNELATGLDINLLHKIRSILDNDSANGSRSYQTFLQTVSLYNRNAISADDLLESTRPLFPRHVDVWKKFCDMITVASPKQDTVSCTSVSSDQSTSVKSREKDREAQSSPTTAPLSDSERFDRSPRSSSQTAYQPLLSVIGDAAQKRLDLDFNNLRTCGVSYRALPANFPQGKCSGRMKCPIATEVLNDTYVSFSSLTSEDSQFVSSKKNQYEEHMYRVEDERYEVDMVTELNRAAMQNLVVVKRRMDRMNREELNRFVLDDSLSGTSAILMRKAIHRVYGDKAGDVIYGLKNCPSTVIPLVIQRMRQKDSEWREAIRIYQRSWEEQDARNYLRSLDHQGATFKQRDAPAIRSKTMVGQIEAIARDDEVCHTPPDPIGAMISASLTQPCLTTRTDLRNPGTFGSSLINVNEGYKEPGAPHLSLVYPPPTVRNALLQDAASLIIHHVKRQTNTSKEDKRTMKFLMRTVVQDFFMADRFPMSDDEEDDDDDEDEEMDQKDDLDDAVDEGAADESDRCRVRRQTRPRRSKDVDDPIGSNMVPPRSCSPGHLECASGHMSHPSLLADVDADTDSEKTVCTNCTGLQPDVAQSPAPGDLGQWEVAAHTAAFPREEHYSILYGNNHWYSFLRLHHLLICRLQLLRSRSLELSIQAANEKSATPLQAAEVLRLKRHGDIDPSDYYSRALTLVKDLLDGGEDVTRYEDRLRNMFGIYAYPWFTLDRLVINIVRQLHALASGDELSSRLTALHRSWTGGPAMTADSTCGSPYTRLLQASGTFHYGCVRGPLCTRVCRLAHESSYRAQALALVASYSSQVGTNNGSSAQSANQSAGPGSATGQPGTACPAPGTSTLPNCYALVMLTEASTLLIRLLSPLVSAGDPGTGTVTSLVSSGLSPHHKTHNISAAASPLHHFGSEQDTSEPSCPSGRWFDYLSSHLTWTLGYVPRHVASRIRPVFLYRTVRRCVRALTRKAYLRRQQELVNTGDTQPEELLVRIACGDRIPKTTGDSLTATSASPQLEPTEAIATELASSPKASENLPSSVTFEHDAWEFMCHVFKSDLTRKELFRDTFSSDCMQFTDRLTTKTQPRSHKLNWSVGSYGIFIRRKRDRVLAHRSAQKWHELHAKLLEAQASDGSVKEHSIELPRIAPAPIDTDPSAQLPVSSVDEDRKPVVDIATDSDIGGDSSGRTIPMDCSSGNSRLEVETTDPTDDTTVPVAPFDDCPTAEQSPRPQTDVKPEYDAS